MEKITTKRSLKCAVFVALTFVVSNLNQSDAKAIATLRQDVSQVSRNNQYGQDSHLVSTEIASVDEPTSNYIRDVLDTKVMKTKKKSKETILERIRDERDAATKSQRTATSSATERANELVRLSKLELKVEEQLEKQRVADKDHLLMEKWLADNINDLHRELKQTENDFEHYAQVTKNMLTAQSERVLRQQLATASSHLMVTFPSPLSALLAASATAATATSRTGGETRW